MNLSTKIAVLIGCVVSVGVVMVALFAYFAISDDIRLSIGERQLEAARQTIDKIDRLVAEKISIIQSIAGLESSRMYWRGVASEAAIMREDLEKLSGYSGPWQALKIFDSNRKPVASIDDALSASDSLVEAENLALGAALGGNLYYSSRVTSSGLDCVIMAAPIRRILPSGPSVVGAVVGRLPWEVVVEILNTLETSATLVDGSGSVIALSSNQPARLLGEKIKSPSVLSVLAFRSGQSLAEARDTIIGEAAIVAFAPEKGFGDYLGNGWGLVLEQPVSSLAFVASRSSFIITVLTILIFAVVVALLIFLLLHYVVNPIKQLTSLVKTMASGNLTVRSNISGSDELSQLSAAVDEMADKLEQSKQDLEKKVAERTAELEIRSHELERMNKFMVDRELRMAELKKEISKNHEA